jgi:nucleoside phosphorylase
MESATLFAVGARAEVPVACVLTVSDTFDARGARAHIDDHALLAAAEAMGAVAVAALSA